MGLQCHFGKRHRLVSQASDIVRTVMSCEQCRYLCVPTFSASCHGRFYDTPLAFVLVAVPPDDNRANTLTASSQTDKVRRRGRLVNEILAGMRNQLRAWPGQADAVTSQFTHVVVCGELNFPVDLPHHRARALIQESRWDELFLADQLRIQREAGEVRESEARPAPNALFVCLLVVSGVFFEKRPRPRPLPQVLAGFTESRFTEAPTILAEEGEGEGGGAIMWPSRVLWSSHPGYRAEVLASGGAGATAVSPSAFTAAASAARAGGGRQSSRGGRRQRGVPFATALRLEAVRPALCALGDLRQLMSAPRGARGQPRRGVGCELTVSGLRIRGLRLPPPPTGGSALLAGIASSMAFTSTRQQQPQQPPQPPSADVYVVFEGSFLRPAAKGPPRTSVRPSTPPPSWGGERVRLCSFLRDLGRLRRAHLLLCVRQRARVGADPALGEAVVALRDINIPECGGGGGGPPFHFAAQIYRDGIHCGKIDGDLQLHWE
eukprot:COSAG01_NODE_3652_length_5823_cov_16.582635_4_plen_491_part_00